MQRLLFIVFMTILTFSAFSAFAADEETLSNEDAQKILSSIIPDVKILETRPAQIKGLWEIAVEAKGQKGIVYLESSRKYLVSGSIVDLKTKANLTQERSIELNKIDVSQIPLDDALVMGEKDAKYRVVVFDDPD